MKSRVCAVAIAAVLTSACAHSYPDLATFKNPELRTNEELGAVLAEAERLQHSYDQGYKATAERQDVSQLPIIGGAAAAAWILLNNKDNAAKKAGKVGIGTLALSSARDQLWAKGLPEAYISGHGALTCVLAEGSFFHGTAATLRRERLRQALDQLTAELRKTFAARYREPKPPAAGNLAETLRLARTVADQAIAAARTAEAAALAQQERDLSAPPVFRNAISNVSVRVASRGRVRPDVDFAGLRDRMFTPSSVPDAPVDGTRVGAMSGNDAQAVITELTNATANLTSRTALLVGATPDYSASLDRVKKCPEQVKET